MCPLKETQRVIDIVDDIKGDMYQLPSIQRLFVWKQDQVLKLFDSIMNGFPVGAIIVWTPPENNIRYKTFVKDYETGLIVISQEPHPGAKQPYMVLDGQQRLQSLFIGFRGSFDKDQLFLKIDEYADENTPEMHYRFVFMNSEMAKSDPACVHLNELIQLEIEDIDQFVNSRLPATPVDVQSRAVKIVARFISAFKVNSPIHLQEMGSKFSYDDVLTVFERVNSGGTKLSKSDLLFSIVTSRIPNMEERFRTMVEDLNNGGRFEFTTDFVIKTAFVVFDKRAKYEFDKLRDPKFIQKLETCFPDLEEAVTSLREWMDSKALIRGGRFLPSQLALIPIIDYLLLNNKFKYGPEDGSESQAIRQYLYMTYFTNLWAYGADSVLDQIHDILFTANAQQPGIFPIQKLGEFMVRRKKLDAYQFRSDYLGNLGVVLNIISGGVSELPKKRGWSLENDHIFPRAELERLQIAKDVNNVGNFRLLPKLPNIKKRDNMPDQDTEFFGKDNPELSSLYASALAKLSQETFSAFVEKRRALILEKVINFLGF